jgi:hypothetical protein
MELDTFCLETSEAAAYCRMSPSYFEKLRYNGKGPLFLKLGRRVKYRRPDLIDWIQTRVRRSTSATLAPL